MRDSMVDELNTALMPSLGDLVDGTSFSDVCNSYFKLFEVPMRVFDDKSNLIAEATRSYPVCKRFAEQDEGRKICIATRMKVKGAMPENKRLMSVDCMCGLRYTAAPIAFQGAVVGKLVFGPFRPSDSERQERIIFDHDQTVDLSPTNEILQAMRKTPSSVLRKIATAILSVMDAILFSAHKALVTSQMHIASVQESYREITQKNQELEEMQDRMKEFERIKASFLATVSHELRTPLTSIIGYSDMLSEGFAGNLDEEQRQFIDTIKTKGEELLKLISAILDFSQIESGRLKLAKHEVDPKALVSQVVDESGDAAARRGIRLATSFDDDMGPVYLDADRIRSAVGHLVDNAIKFSAPGGMVKVSAQVTEADLGGEDEEDGFGLVLMTMPNWLDISVQDFGDGIEEEDQKRIFNPFTQLDDSTTREHGGAGLGLAVVKQLVEAHGGKVCITSIPDEGSNFTIRIPILPSE